MVVVVMRVSGQQGGSGPEGRAGDTVDGGRTALDNKTSLLNTPLLSSPRGARDHYSDSPFKHSLKDSSIDDLEQSADGTAARPLTHSLARSLTRSLTIRNKHMHFHSKTCSLKHFHTHRHTLTDTRMHSYSHMITQDQTRTRLPLDTPAPSSLPVLGSATPHHPPSPPSPSCFNQTAAAWTSQSWWRSC